MNRLNQVSAQFDLYYRVIKAQLEDTQSKKIKESIKMGELKEFRLDNGVLRCENRYYVQQVNELKEEAIREACGTPYTTYPGITTMYQDLRHKFLWNKMKKGIAEFVQQCQICQQVKAEHMKPPELLIPLPIFK